MKRPLYKIEYAPETEEHFEWLTARDIATVLDTVARQLSYEPTVRTATASRSRRTRSRPGSFGSGSCG